MMFLQKSFLVEDAPFVPLDAPGGVQRGRYRFLCIPLDVIQYHGRRVVRYDNFLCPSKRGHNTAESSASAEFQHALPFNFPVMVTGGYQLCQLDGSVPDIVTEELALPLIVRIRGSQLDGSESMALIYYYRVWVSM